MKIYKTLISLILIFHFAVITRAQESTLGDTLFSFNAGVLTPTPDRLLMGLEFADGHFWVTGADPDDLWQHKLYKISADGQTLVDSWEYGLEFASWKDLAYDGAFLYVADIDTIRQIDMSTGQKTGVSFKAPQYYNSGLAYNPVSDHFWVSGENSIIFEVDREGDIINSVPFIPDLGASGLAWDSFSQGGPYLWIWSMKYTSNDVRPKAFQLNPATGILTELSFEGVLMNPQAPYAADYALGATITDELIEGKVTFVGLHGSSYQNYNDQLDWVVVYDLDPEGMGVPGPEISVTPASIQNNLLPGDSVDVPVFISNLNDQYNLSWFANLEYPGMWDTIGIMGDPLLTFDATALTAPDTNRNMRGIAFIDDYIYVSTSKNFNNQFSLFKIKKDGSEIVQTSTLYSSFSGWSAITSDGQYIYGADQYIIQQYNPATGVIVATFPRPNFFPNAIAYDPQQEHFFLGNSNGAIMVTNKNGDEINFFVTSMEIKGLSWDNQSPGGPFLWAYHSTNEGVIKATRLNPNTAAPTGVEFLGINMSVQPEFFDTPSDIIVTADWKENNLVIIALHNSFSESGEGADQIVVYDLATTPPPKWIELSQPNFGLTEPLITDTLWVRLHAIMEDTLMEAQIVIKSNDVLNPAVNIPVNFRMLPEVIININEATPKKDNLIRSIYPNPASTEIIAKFSNLKQNGTIQIYNTFGSLQKQFNISKDAESLSIPIFDLSPGIYQLILHTGNTTTHKLFIVQ